MKKLLDKIDKYLIIAEQKDAICLSLNQDGDLKYIIEMVRKSENKDRVLNMLNKEVKEKINKMIDGGIL